MDFRPHILKATIKTADDTIDPATGAVVPGTTCVIEFPCRVSPNGEGIEVQGEDGNMVRYSNMVHAETGSIELPFGTAIHVFEGAKIKAKGKVVRFFDNTMNVRIWVR